MSTITIEPALQTKLDQLARSVGRPLEEIVTEAINEHLERLNEQQLEADIQVFEQIYPDLKAQYMGQFVAIYAGQVIDADTDFERLFLRVQARLGDLTVLIRPVGPSLHEEWLFRSPRLEQG